MKKITTTILLSALFKISLFAQGGYYYIKTVGTDANYTMNPTSGTSTLLNATTATTNFVSAIAALPFPVDFYGNTFNAFRATSSGYIVFGTAAHTDMATNVALPNVNAPKNAIFAFWDTTVMSPVTQGSTTFPSDIRTWTYGTTGNRVFVIQWRLVLKGAITSPTNVTYYAIRFYENDATKFDIVLNYGFGSFDATVGCQNSDGTEATQLPASPNINFGGNSGSYDATKSDVYTFYYRSSLPNYDMSILTNTNIEFIAKNQNVNLTGVVANFGKTAVTSFKLNYTVNGGSVNTQTISSVNITPKGGTYTYSHSTPLNVAAAGSAIVKIWVSEINSTNADEVIANDTLTKTFTVFDQIIPRKALHEVFTSSTCPPCKPGNEKLDGILFNNQGKFTTIKYQFYFPGNGDPYYTPEALIRANYYGGVNSVPNLFIDGKWNSNPNSYTQSIFDQYQSLPSLVEITPTQEVNANEQKIKVTAKIKPITSIAGGNYILRMAVVERRTAQNIRTNGEVNFYWVMKKMLPDPSGLLVSLTDANVEQTFEQEFTFPGAFKLTSGARINSSAAPTGSNYNGINLATEHSVEEFNDLITVVFIQNDNTKEILQSEWTSKGIYSSANEVKLTDLVATIYPNPATKQFNIKLAESKTGKVAIYDLTGKRVMEIKLSGEETEVNCNNLQNGLYVVEITVDGKTQVQKLNIAR
jgi:glutaredoxin